MSTGALLFFRHQNTILVNVKSVNERYWNSGLEKTTSKHNVKQQIQTVLYLKQTQMFGECKISARSQTNVAL